ncbi:uncharacterized protein LOC144169651 [Haemaphysalis longicornis]
MCVFFSFMFASDGATMALSSMPENSAISKGEASPALEKAGKALETLGKVLQGETGPMSKEELRNIIADLKNIDEEYFIGDLFNKIGDAVKSVGNVVDEAIKIGK